MVKLSRMTLPAPFRGGCSRGGGALFFFESTVSAFSNLLLTACSSALSEAPSALFMSFLAMIAPR
jgi:hypothetical protein